MKIEYRYILFNSNHGFLTKLNKDILVENNLLELSIKDMGEWEVYISTSPYLFNNVDNAVHLLSVLNKEEKKDTWVLPVNKSLYEN